MAEAEGGGDSGREDQESSQETIKDDINLSPSKTTKKQGMTPEEETGRLIILTSDGWVNLSGKVLQLYSPLF